MGLGDTVRLFRYLFLWCSLVFLTLPSAFAQTYTVDELLPDPYSAFVPLRTGQFNISNSHFDPRTGTVGNPFPSNWDYLPMGTSVRLKILVPPGVNLVTWRVEASNLVAFFGACDEQGINCVDQSYTPSLWPVGYNGQSPTATPVDQLPAVTTPKIVYLTVKTTAIDFDFLSMTVNYNIANASLYEAWRQARNWAGGSGDCDGLGGAYCNGTVTPNPGTTTPTPTTTTPTPTTTIPTAGTFTLAGLSDTVTSGSSYALISSVAMASCTATSTAQAAASTPAIATGGQMVTGNAPTLNDSESSATLTVQCIGTNNAVGTKVLTVNQLPGAVTVMSGIRNVGSDGKLALSVKFVPATSQKGKTVTFWVGAELQAFGWTVEPMLFTKNQSGGWEEFSFLNMLGDSNAVLKRVAYVEEGVTIPILASEFFEADLKTLKTRVFGAYRIEGEPIKTFPNPFYDCSGSSCITR